MKLLAWDTSSKVGALVAIEGEETSYRVASEFTLDVNRTHSERLLWGAHQVLQSLDWKLEEVSHFGVGLGPGSFTGLRIGLMTAKTLAHALNKPLVGVSSLAALARPLALYFSEEPVFILAVTEACQGEVYALWGQASDIETFFLKKETGVSPSESTIESDDGAVGGCREGCFLIEDLKQILRQTMAVYPNYRWASVGNAKNREEWLPNETQVSLRGLFLDQVQGRYLGDLVHSALLANLGKEALEVIPRYLRVSNAEKKRWQV